MSKDPSEKRTGTPSPGAAPRPVAPAVRQRLQAIFEHAQGSSQKGDFDYANDLYTQCVVEDPGNLVYLKQFLANLAKKHGGHKKGGRFAGLRSKGARTALHKAASKAQWREAFQAGCDALKQNPWDVATLMALADASEALAHQECGLYYLRWALEADIHDPAVNRRAAQTLANLGQFEQAILCWRRVLQARPGDQEAEKAVSQLSVEQTIQQGGYNEGLLNPGDPADAAAPASLSVAESAARRSQNPAAGSGPEMSEDALRAAIEADPSDVPAYQRLADFYTKAQRFHEAERVLTQALPAAGGDLGIREQLEDAQLRRIRQQVEIARQRARKERTKPAIALAQQMAVQANQVELEIFAARAQREPGNSHLQFELGLRLSRAGKFREAIQAFQAARDDARRRAHVEIHLGDCFQQIRQYKLAMTSYEAAVEACDATDAETQKMALYQAGALAAALDDRERAEKHLGALAAIDFGYRDVADRLDKLAALRDSG